MSFGSDKVKPHSTLAMIFHWGFIAVFVYAIFKQISDIDELQNNALLQFEIVFAAIFLLILLVRFVFMRATRSTALPESTAPTIRLLARLGHLAMYGSLAMIAISGLMIGALYGSGTTQGTTMDLVIALHEFSVLATYVTIAIHIAAALYHRVKGDGIWSAMVPIFREKSN